MPTTTQSRVTRKQRAERKRLGEVVRRHREGHKMTLRELHEKTGIPHNTIHGIESGRGKMTAEQLVKLTTVFGPEFVRETAPPVATARTRRTKHA